MACAEAIKDIKFHASKLETKDRHCYDDSRYTSFIPSVLRTRFGLVSHFQLNMYLFYGLSILWLTRLLLFLNNRGLNSPK